MQNHLFNNMKYMGQLGNMHLLLIQGYDEFSHLAFHGSSKAFLLLQIWKTCRSANQLQPPYRPSSKYQFWNFIKATRFPKQNGFIQNYQLNFPKRQMFLRGFHVRTFCVRNTHLLLHHYCVCTEKTPFNNNRKTFDLFLYWDNLGPGEWEMGLHIVEKFWLYILNC